MLSRRGRIRIKDTDFGCKGGTGPTAGRKASVYEAVAPDGVTRFRKRSYFVHTDEAIAMVYEHHGIWYISAIADEPKSWGTQVAVKATKVK